MKYLLIFLCFFLAGCDDLPKSGGNTGAYWYMEGWRSSADPDQIIKIVNGKPEWVDMTPKEQEAREKDICRIRNKVRKQLEREKREVYQCPTDKELVEDMSKREVFYSPYAFPPKVQFQ